MRLDGFHHVAISVPDLARAILWYGDVLGFAVEREWDIPAAGARVAYLVRGAMRLEMFQVTGAAAMPDSRRDPRLDLATHGHKHLAFATGDYVACRETMTARGAAVVLEVGELFGRAFFVNDPFGNVLEFVETGSGT